MIICQYNKITYDSERVMDRKIEEIKAYIRKNEVVVIDFKETTRIDYSWVYRLYVSVYRELRYDDNVDDSLVVRNVPHLFTNDFERIKHKARMEVWSSVVNGDNGFDCSQSYLNSGIKYVDEMIIPNMPRKLSINIKKIFIILLLLICDFFKNILWRENIRAAFRTVLVFGFMLLSVVISFYFLLDNSIIKAVTGGGIIQIIVSFFIGIIIEIVWCYLGHGIVFVFFKKYDFRKWLPECVKLIGNSMNLISLLAILAVFLTKKHACELNLYLLTLALVLVSYNIAVEIYIRIILEEFDKKLHNCFDQYIEY